MSKLTRPLSLYRKLEWLTDEDEELDVLVVPNSDKHLLMFDGGCDGGVCYVLALTRVEIELGTEFTKHDGRYHQHYEQLGNGVSTLQGLVIGEQLYGVLQAAGAPLWATDANVVKDWLKDRVFTITDTGIVMEDPWMREQRWKKRKTGWLS